jgi:threonine synthase
MANANEDSGSFLNKLKSIFIVEDPQKPNTSTTTTTTTTAQNTQPVTPQNTTPPVIVTGNGQVSEKFMNALLESMQNNNTPGFDYFEFRQSIQNLSKMPMDEATRYQSAFAMAQTMNVLPQTLVSSAQNYVQILAAEEQKFHQALANKEGSDVNAKQQEISNLDAAIKQKSEQIRELTEQIQQNQQQMEALKSQISEATSKVAATKNDFVVTYNALVNEIKKDIDNMQRYLK